MPHGERAIERNERRHLRLRRTRAARRHRAANDKNAQGELYLTDTVSLLVAASYRVVPGVAVDYRLVSASTTGRS